MSQHVVELSDDGFEQQVLQSSKPVLVDFWAPWCGPCRALAPIVEELAGEHQKDLVVGKLNVDDHPNTAGKFGIRNIPTLLLFKSGKVVETIVGMKNKTALEESIKKHMG